MTILRRLFSIDSFFFLIIIYLLIKGWLIRENSFLTAESGLGYQIGIIGASMMLILLLYPLRKHARFMQNWGPIRYWFQIHMMLGVTGPLLILYHSNFGLGSTNSNVALISMLIVSGSGLLGRVFYTKIHDGLYGRKVELNELKAILRELKSHLPESNDFENTLKQYEIRMLNNKNLLLLFLLMPFRRLDTWLMRIKIKRRFKATAKKEEHNKEINRYFNVMMRVSDFSLYERLFSLWHLLHIPLFIMLIISGVVHVFAVHIY